MAAKRKGFARGGEVLDTRDEDDKDANEQKLSSDSMGKSITSGFSSMIGIGAKAGMAKGGKVKKLKLVARRKR